MVRDGPLGSGKPVTEFGEVCFLRLSWVSCVLISDLTSASVWTFSGLSLHDFDSRN